MEKDTRESSRPDPFPFKYVENVENEVLPILKARLPISANVYNMAVFHKRFQSPSMMAFYTFHTDDDDDEADPGKNKSLILAAYFREDYGMRYNISLPPPGENIPNEFIQAFVKTNVIDWSKRLNFAAIDKRWSNSIKEISTLREAIKNLSRVMKTKFYVMPPKEAQMLDISYTGNLELKRLDPDFGTEFTCSTWKYAMKNSRIAIRKLLESNESVGVHIDGKPVCGININGCGLMGMLYTLEEHRGNGYAKLAMKSLIKQLADNGAYPCSAVEVDNYASQAFHESIGMKFSHFADFATFIPPDV